MRRPLSVGVVGAQHREDGLVRAFESLPQASLRWLCGETPRPWTHDAQTVRWAGSLDDLLADEDLDAVVFASPLLAAGGRARAALEADKHVLVAGPLAFSARDAEELSGVAAARGLCLWAHLPLLEHPASRRLRSLVRRQQLGEVYYLHATRFVPAGDHEADLLWGAGAEVVALCIDLLTDQPVDVAGRAEAYGESTRPDVVVAELRFATGIVAHLHLSRLEREVVERVSVVASDRTAVLDTGAHDRELAIRDREKTTTYALTASEVTRAACARFLGAIRSPGAGEQGREAAAIVSVLEALERSCRSFDADLGAGLDDRAARPAGVERPVGNVLAFRR